MYDKKLTELPNITVINGDELLYIVDNVSSTPSSKSVTVNGLISNILTDINTKDITAEDIYANSLTITSPSSTPSNNQSSWPIGRIGFDENYLYIKVNSNTVKRVPLSTF